MEVYLGRQPILDRGRTVVGYELLFRSSQANYCDSADPVAATSQVIVNAVLGVGLDRLLGGKPAFINFDRTLLLGDWTTLIPPGKAVIEILETVPADPEVLSACHRLREQGYALALDDCLNDSRTAAFAPFVDILKVDFQETSPAVQAEMVARYRKFGVRMVAEKVETEAEFRRAGLLGYDYFQGYFFARPAVLQAARIPVSRMSGLRLLKQIQRQDLDFQIIADLIRHDVAFSHSLLTYLNSAAFHWAARVESIRHGLFLLGPEEVRKWGWMASLSSLSHRRPPVFMAQVLLRGRFCEAIAGAAKRSPGASDPFLLGMFSLLDAILDRPLQQILEDLNIGDNIRNALLGTAPDTDFLFLVLRIAKSWEVGDWSEVAVAANAIGLSSDDLRACYLESLSWVDAIHSADDLQGQWGQASTRADFHRALEISPSAAGRGSLVQAERRPV
jgi:EAL and modified HD-GYP domain-containing signal transduction protein